jgi:membrane protease YdiL (CAAX protease family)
MSRPDGEVGEPPSTIPSFTRKAVYFGWLFEGGLILFAFGLGGLVKESPLATLKWDLAALGLGILASGPMLLGLIVLMWLPVRPVRRLTQLLDQFGRPFFAPYTVFDLAVLSLIAGFGEEMLFRAVIQGAIDHRFGAWIALSIASVLFGLAHAITPTYVALATLAGIYLGGMWMLSENLLAVIVAHALYDFLALVYLLRVRAPA